jgi:hypothetical protein
MPLVIVKAMWMILTSLCTLRCSTCAISPAASALVLTLFPKAPVAVELPAGTIIGTRLPPEVEGAAGGEGVDFGVVATFGVLVGVAGRETGREFFKASASSQSAVGKVGSKCVRNVSVAACSSCCIANVHLSN